MTNLAIKGHKTRGKEVIEILEMLGGENLYSKSGYEDGLFYYLSDEQRICSLPISESYRDFILFTIEEFLEKFPYRVGDKVKAARINDFIGRIINVRWDENENQIIYVVEWDDATKSTLPYFANGLQPYKEEKMEDIIKIDIPKGYEFAGFDDDKQQVVFEKISCQYPKNFKECCEVLGCKANDFFTNFSYNGCDVEISEYEDKVDDLLKNFRKLRYARDAYWKIAGEQMGLGKPWKPDFTNNDEERYSIYTLANKVERDFCGVGDVNTILCFPTEEMRDAFLENFGHLIELCKELL